jgi:hypothetical protein
MIFHGGISSYSITVENMAWSEDEKSITFGANGDMWLKVRIDGAEGWIHSEEDFEAVGLPQAG